MTTTKIKTSELVGESLDWAVAWAEGDKVSAEDGYVVVAEFNEQHGDFFNVCYSPSTDWSQGGPMIERHEITVRPVDGKWWAAHINDSSQSPCSYGLSPLIAACRAIVAAKLGDVVSVPSELLEQTK